VLEEGVSYGKRLPGAVYIFRPRQKDVPPTLWQTLARAELAAKPDPAWNLLKLHTRAFCPEQAVTEFFDAWTMMQVCLELGRLDEAKKVARYCSGLLATADDDFTRASMADALASYCLSIGDPESALKLWREAPAEPTFQRQRFCGIVKAQLLQALQATKAGLAALAGRKWSDFSSEIRLPGNAATPISDAERELKDLQDGIKRLVPEMVEANPARARAH